ncbi:MAG TPA: quinone-dependent dihydroorotate dehydrogenase, partial [Stenotrophobium sp.]|nr:quinone-dependent dihydroorotate dehydrogenase [Stenotrophobium sp.]
MLYALARTALFRLDAEQAHNLTIKLFSEMPMLATAPFCQRVQQDPVKLMGLQFPNRIGLAAGLDKNGECITAWGRLGFGFAEIGTVTPRPQPGNPRPRMFRLPQQQAIINRLGFNNKGVDYLLDRVRATRENFQGILGINIGKNFDTPIDRAGDDYVECLRKVYPFADYVTINISSPNTRNLRDLQQEAQLHDLLLRLTQARAGLMQQHGVRRPLLVKIAPDVSAEQIGQIARIARELDIDGLIATNTTISRPPQLAGLRHATEQGGLSGAPLRGLADDTLRRLRAAVGDDFVLVGVGGVTQAAHARAKRDAGADLVQIYTGF